MNKKIQSLAMVGIIAANLCVNSIYSFANEDIEKNVDTVTQRKENGEISEDTKLHESISKTSSPKEVLQTAKNYSTKNSWYDPSIYKLVSDNQYVDTLIDGYISYRDVKFKYVEDLKDYMNVVVEITSDNYIKDDYTTIEFYTDNNGTLQWIGSIDYDLYSTKNATLYSKVDSDYYQNQEYIYMRLGVSDDLYASYYSDVTTFKIKNPQYALNGWVKSGGKWYYYKEGIKQTGWILDGGKYYYCNQQGEMQTGWLELSGKKYYLNASGVMLTGWHTIDGKQYYFDNSGALQNTPPAKNGWMQENGKWYYYSNNNKQTGWVKDGSTWYYCNKDGSMKNNEWLQDGSYWYYLGSSGAMVKGWQLIKGSYYFFNPNGTMVSNDWLKDGGQWYYLEASGAMAKGWELIKGSYYYFNDNGTMKSNDWLQDGGQWYYLKSSGAMAKGWELVKGSYYYFNINGTMKSSEWLKDGGYWYYLKSDGRMACNEIVTISNEGNKFNSVGKWLGTSKYTEGTYRVGSDLPAGKYVIIPKYANDYIYFSVSSDSNQSNILFNEFIGGKAFVEVKNGEYLSIERAYMLPAEGYSNYPSDGQYKDGYYRVGIDIPAGNYRVVDNDGDGAYWSVGDYRGNIWYNDYFYGNSYVTVEHGDILILSNGAYIKR